MEQFIYVLRPVRLEMLTEGPTATESEAVSAHVAYLEENAAAGTVLLAGRSQTADEDTFGIVILKAASLEAAAEFMANDPAIKGDAMSARLFP
ncbi:MAG: hypothetical protein HN816_13650, partial [Gammaproteobacteria bacterium]|nr:hypothetical protein [Gammaproteobacteria bacterium]